MDRSSPGPSNCKKPKLTYKKQKGLTEQELIAALEESDDEKGYDLVESSDDNFEIESDSELEDVDLDDTGK